MVGAPEREVWIGLVEVRPEEGNDIFEGAPGAYSNVFALAHSVEDYMTITAEALLESGLVAIGLDDPEPLRERQSRVQLSTEIAELGKQAQTGDVVWSTFHVFESEGDE